MSIETTQKDLRAFFEIAADDADRDGAHRFFIRLSDEALEKISNSRTQDQMTIPDTTIDLGVRVMNMLQALTGKKINHVEHHARVASEALLNEVKDKEDIPDALVESCKDAWDYGLAQLGYQCDMTAGELYARRPKMDFKL